MTECEFCELDVDIDDNPEWEFTKAIAALDIKFPHIQDNELFWCCDSCEKLMRLRFDKVASPIITFVEYAI